MFCRNCGKELEDEWKICPNCGTPAIIKKDYLAVKRSEVDSNINQHNLKEKNNYNKMPKKKRHFGKMIVAILIAFLILSFVIGDSEDSTQSAIDDSDENVQFVENTAEVVDDSGLSMEENVDNDYVDSSELSTEENIYNDFIDSSGLSAEEDMDNDYVDSSEQDSYTMMEKEQQYSNILSNSVWSMEYFGNYISELKEIDSDFSEYIGKIEEIYSKSMESVMKSDMLYANGKKGKYKIVDFYEGVKYIYQGDVKKDLPDGLGMVAEIIKWDASSGPVITPIYVGEFKKGKFHGEGVSYYTIEELDKDTCLMILSQFDNMQEAADNYFNNLKYIGDYKNGQESGSGVHIVFPNYIMSMNYLLNEDYQIVEGMGLNDLIVYIGDFKKGKEDGDIREYVRNVIRYEGKMKKGEYDGKGILYNEDGEVEYKGEWRNGEIKD